MVVGRPLFRDASLRRCRWWCVAPPHMPLWRTPCMERVAAGAEHFMSVPCSLDEIGWCALASWPHPDAQVQGCGGIPAPSESDDKAASPPTTDMCACHTDVTAADQTLRDPQWRWEWSEKLIALTLGGLPPMPPPRRHRCLSETTVSAVLTRAWMTSQHVRHTPSHPFSTAPSPGSRVALSCSAWCGSNPAGGAPQRRRAAADWADPGGPHSRQPAERQPVRVGFRGPIPIDK